MTFQLLSRPEKRDTTPGTRDTGGDAAGRPAAKEVEVTRTTGMCVCVCDLHIITLCTLTRKKEKDGYLDQLLTDRLQLGDVS